MTRTVKTTEEKAKHGTRTAEGQKRMAERKKAVAVELELVDGTASRRDVDAALKSTRIDFLRSMTKDWGEVEGEMLHLADIEFWPGQVGFAPFGTITFQFPLAYVHRIAELVQYGGGVVFARLYRLRPEELTDAANTAFEEIAQELQNRLDAWSTRGPDTGTQDPADGPG